MYKYFLTKIFTKMTKKNISIAPNGNVYLSLPQTSYKKQRLIGWIIDRILILKRTSKHLYRKNNGISICYDLLNSYKDVFEIVFLNYEGRHYWTTRTAWIAKGEIIDNPDSNLERQICLPLNSFCTTREQAMREYNQLTSISLFSKTGD